MPVIFNLYNSTSLSTDTYTTGKKRKIYLWRKLLPSAMDQDKQCFSAILFFGWNNHTKYF